MTSEKGAEDFSTSFAELENRVRDLLGEVETERVRFIRNTRVSSLRMKELGDMVRSVMEQMTLATTHWNAERVDTLEYYLERLDKASRAAWLASERRTQIGLIAGLATEALASQLQDELHDIAEGRAADGLTERERQFWEGFVAQFNTAREQLDGDKPNA